MAAITLGGNPVNTIGNLPAVGSKAPVVDLVTPQLQTISLDEYFGKTLILNIFPSVNTGVCAQSVRQFNIEAAELDNTEVLCISRDLPFAQDQFCGAEGIADVSMLSDFREGAFGKAYGVTFADGGFQGLLSRSVVVIDSNGTVVYTEQVGETGEEPNYKAALSAAADA